MYSVVIGEHYFILFYILEPTEDILSMWNNLTITVMSKSYGVVRL